MVSGRFTVWKDVPRATRAASTGRAERRWSMPPIWSMWCGRLGPHKLASLGQCGPQNTRCWVSARPFPDKRLFSALLDLLPPPYRLDFSLTTGLKVSASRPYRLSILPADREEHRRAIRQVRLAVLDLTNDPPAKFAPHSGWPLLVHQLLREHSSTRRWPASSKSHRADSSEQDSDLLAEQWREKLEKDAEQPAVLTPFPHEIAKLLGTSTGCRAVPPMLPDGTGR